MTIWGKGHCKTYIREIITRYQMSACQEQIRLECRKTQTHYERGGREGAGEGKSRRDKWREGRGQCSSVGGGGAWITEGFRKDFLAKTTPSH